MANLIKFEEVIKNFLEAKANEDEDFRIKYSDPKKNIKDCIQYILSEVKKNFCKEEQQVALTNDEVFLIALNYYENSEDIEIKNTEGSVIISEDIPLTVEEKNQIRAKMIEDYQKEVEEREKKKRERAKDKAIINYKNEVKEELENEIKRKKNHIDSNQLSLF